MTGVARYGAIALVLFQMTTPASASEPAATRGQGDYKTYCAACHGSRGGGDGPLAAMLVPKPSPHSDAARMDALSDEYLFRLLKEGGPALGRSALMNAWGKTFSEEQILDLIAFIRTLSRSRLPPSQP